MIDLPEFLPLKITQSPARASRQQLDSLDHLIAVVPEKPGRATFQALPKPTQLERLFRRARKAQSPFVTTHLDNKRSTAVTVSAFAVKDRFRQLGWARKLIAEACRAQASRLGIVLVGLAEAERDAALSALISAADAAAFRLPSFKSSEPTPARGLQSLKLLATSPRIELEPLRRGHLGNNLARWLTALPPNKLTAESYRAATKALATRHGLKYEFFDIARLKKLKAGAFLAVAQGNADENAGIIRLRYRPASKQQPALALVGKGILFDTGGTNLKPFKSMLDMHMDMQGSAVALGAGIELAEARVPYAFDVWLAVTENRISATAYKSQDVVIAANGTSIQVIHTDAEGRMVLADTLALAAEQKPALIIDYATLTGTCISALTTRYSGVFSNRGGAARDLLAAGTNSGERVWPFPLDDDYDEPLKSDVADIRQCAVEGSGDHIFAARFLKRFVPDDCAWIHLDLSAGQHKGGLGAIATEITGFGVGYTLQLLGLEDPAELAAQWAADA